MSKSCHAISRCSWYNLSLWYRFRVFQWMFLIGIWSGVPEEAFGIRIRAWLHLKTGFQCLSFCEKFQFANCSWGAACSLLGLGLCSSTCKEAIRSTISTKISCNYELKIWFFFIIFPISFTWFLCKSYPIQSNSP